MRAALISRWPMRCTVLVLTIMHHGGLSLIRVKYVSLKTLISATASYSDARLRVGPVGVAGQSLGRIAHSLASMLASQKSETKSQTYVRESTVSEITSMTKVSSPRDWQGERPMERPRAPSRVRTSRAYRNPHYYLIFPLFYYSIQVHITDTQERRDGHRVVSHELRRQHSGTVHCILFTRVRSYGLAFRTAYGRAPTS